MVFSHGYLRQVSEDLTRHIPIPRAWDPLPGALAASWSFLITLKSQ